MSTNRRRTVTRTNGDAGGAGTTRWLLASFGAVWLFRFLLRRWTPKRARPVSLACAPARVPVASPHHGHESRDANVKWIFGIVGFLFVSGLCVHFILGGWLGVLTRSAAPVDRWAPAPRTTQATLPKNVPVLQVAPPLDLEQFRARESAELNTYGWVDRTAGIVRVPVDRAMELVLREGLPVRRGSNDNRAGPSSYELLRQRPQHRENEIREPNE